jgi:hypothetical protein
MINFARTIPHHTPHHHNCGAETPAFRPVFYPHFARIGAKRIDTPRGRKPHGCSRPAGGSQCRATGTLSHRICLTRSACPAHTCVVQQRGGPQSAPAATATPTHARSGRQAAPERAIGRLAAATAPHRVGCNPAACGGLKPRTVNRLRRTETTLGESPTPFPPACQQRQPDPEEMGCREPLVRPVPSPVCPRVWLSAWSSRPHVSRETRAAAHRLRLTRCIPCTPWRQP